MEKTLLFLLVCFGDFRDEVEPLSLVPWTVPLLGKNRLFFFSYYLPPSDVIKSLKYHRTDLAMNGEIIPHEMKKKKAKE